MAFFHTSSVSLTPLQVCDVSSVSSVFSAHVYTFVTARADASYFGGTCSQCFVASLSGHISVFVVVDTIHCLSAVSERWRERSVLQISRFS